MEPKRLEHLSILKIEELSIFINKFPEELKSTLNHGKCDISVDFSNIKIIGEKGIITIQTTFLFKYIANDDETLDVLTYSFQISFQLLDLIDYTKKLDDDNFTIDQNLLKLLIQIIVSTGRGLVHGATTGHIINQFPLPIYWVDNLIGDELIPFKNADNVLAALDKLKKTIQ